MHYVAWQRRSKCDLARSRGPEGVDEEAGITDGDEEEEDIGGDFEEDDFEL